MSTQLQFLRDPHLVAARQAWEQRIRDIASQPVFMLPTIASALNIAMNLYGQKFLVSMLTEPEAARHAR